MVSILDHRCPLGGLTKLLLSIESLVAAACHVEVVSRNRFVIAPACNRCDTDVVFSPMPRQACLPFLAAQVRGIGRAMSPCHSCIPGADVFVVHVAVPVTRAISGLLLGKDRRFQGFEKQVPSWGHLANAR